MEIETDIQNNQEKSSYSEITEKVGKKGVGLFNLFNPIFIVLTILKNNSIDKRNRKEELVLKHSNIVNDMPKDILQKLTIKKDNETITPQQSFINYFNKKKKISDHNLIIPQFIEHFHSNKKYLYELVDDYPRTDDFWKSFEEILIKKPVIKQESGIKPNDIKKAKLTIKTKNILKTILSGSGRFHKNIRSSYIRLNQN